MLLRSLWVCLVALTLVPVGSSAQSLDAAHLQASRDLMQKMQVREMTLTSMKMMVDQVRNQQGEAAALPDEIWTTFSSKFDSLTNVIVDSTTQIYGRYYTVNELQELSKLYDNPVMRKMLAVSPQIMAETSTVGAQLGRETMMAIATDYYTRHPEMTKNDKDGPSAPSGPSKKKKK